MHAGPPAPDAAARPVRWQGLSAALLCAMLVSTFPQYAVGVLAPIFTSELGIGEAVIGFAAGGMYIAAAVVSRFAGRGFDHIGGRLALTLLGAGAVASLLLLAAVRSTAMLVAAGILAGMSMGTNNPITNRLISLHIAPGRRGVVIGVKQTGVKVAQVTAGAVVPALAVLVGWRVGLIGIAAVTTLALATSLLFVPREKLQQPLAPALGTAGAARRGLRWLQGYSALMAISMSAVSTYLPLFAVNRLGFSLVRAGLVVTLFAVTATLARILLAVLAERRADPAGVLFLQALGGVSALALLSVAELLGEPALWAAAALGGATVGSWNVVAQLTVITEVETVHSAAVTGAVQSAFLLGLAAGAPFVGLVVHASGSFELAWAATSILPAAAAVVALIHRRGVRLASARPESASPRPIDS